MRLIGTVAGVCAIAVAMAGCSSSAGGSSGSTEPAVVNGATFTLAMAADPGNLDPQATVAGNTLLVSQFAYDSLVFENTDGTIQSWLATAWDVSGTTVTLTLHKDITCADGTPFTAADAAANIAYVADPKNQSPGLGLFIPVGTTAKADVTAGTVTMTTPTAAPFVLQGLASLPMVCASGMKDRKSLAQHTSGTGPYQLDEAVPSDHYSYSARPSYAWGPNGAAGTIPGLPSKVVVKIVANETTATNLLLANTISAATVFGPDAKRLDAAKLFSAPVNQLVGEMWFNQTKERTSADEAVRHALTQAVDLGQLATVLTAGQGGPATTFAASPPVACPGNSVGPALPAPDLEKAKQTLDAAGWTVGTDGVRTKNGTPLALTFVYPAGHGAAVSAAAELASATWKQLGVSITSKAQDDAALQGTAFGAGDWDIVWIPLNVSVPDQLVPFLSGPAPADGVNFAHIDNPAYTDLVTKASAMVGSAGCETWLQAESELVKAANVIPFANSITKTYGNHTSFVISGQLVPTSIRMLAS